jgi:3-oxoacyl-[acyl-carrier protein] reductase
MAGQALAVIAAWLSPLPPVRSRWSPALATPSATFPTASKGALDRITLAAARELAHLGITANVINPGPTDTGWMSDEVRDSGIRRTPLGRLGTVQDVAHLVDFLCSSQGQWINGQLLLSNGGYA